MLNNIPNDSNAEKAVLGCMLFSTEAVEVAISRLKVDDFYTPIHKKIFANMIELHSKGLAVDVISLENKSTDIEYLVNLANIVPTETRLNNYIDIVYKNSFKRELITSCHKIIQTAQDKNEDILDLKSQAMQLIDIPLEIKQDNNDMSHLLQKLKKEMQAKKNDDASFLKYGFKWLDMVTGGVRTGLTYLAARPSIGKTAFALNIATNLMKQSQKVVMFSLEMQDQSIVERMISSYGQIKYDKILKPWLMEQDDWRLYETRLKELENFHFKVFDKVNKIEQMRGILQQEKSKNGLDYVIIDHIHLCETRQKTNGLYEKISYISRQFKLMQMELKVPFLVLVQLGRDPDKEKRQPKLTDLRDSGSLEQDADNVLFLYSKTAGEYDNTLEDGIDTDLIIGKQRAGKRDIWTTMKFYKNTQKFYEKTPF